jgi:DNA primase
MPTWVNYKEIKSCVRIDQVLERYGLLGTLKQKGDNLVGTCPIHKGTNGNQFHVSVAKNNFNCFGDCHDGGNVIDFVVMMDGGDKSRQEDVRGAALKLQEWFGLSFERPRGGRRRAELASASAPAMATASVTRVDADDRLASSQPALPIPALVSAVTPKAPAGAVARETVAATPSMTEAPQAKVNAPLKFALKSLDPDHAYLTERGLTKETLAHFGVGFCTGKGIMAGRIAIPIHNEHGELVAYVGRWPGDEGWPEGEGKYKLPSGFHKSLVVYNLHRARDFAKDSGLIVVEGFFGAMRVWQSGFPNVVALIGSSLSDEQEGLLVDAVGPGGKLTLMFDEDEAGWHGRDGIWKDGELMKPGALQRLASQVYVKVIGLAEEGRQPDKLREDEIQRLLA